MAQITADAEGWFPAAETQDVGANPLGVKAGEFALVLFRGRDGSVAALEDRCPHLNYTLSDGTVIGGDIECSYHGLRFDGSGRCTLLPSAPVPPDRFRVRSFPVLERDGRIYVQIGRPATANG